MSQTLYRKIWDRHTVAEVGGGAYLLYVDRHMLHEGCSPHAFEGLRAKGRTVRRPDLTFAVVDHVVPTADRHRIDDPDAKDMIAELASNTARNGIIHFGLDDPRQGIVHIVGPEQGIVLPGCTVVCGDSHTSTNGAFGSLAFGIGISEVEHVLATQTIVQRPSKAMHISVEGRLSRGVTAKDLILHLIGKIGTAGATGHVIEYAGAAIRALSMEERMTICNMSIEAGARAGLIAPDETTFRYLKNKPFAPTGATWEAALRDWGTLYSDPGADFDSEVRIDADALEPTISWGTSPEDVAPITSQVPSPDMFSSPQKRSAVERSLEYMNLRPGTPFQDIGIDRVFIGSCTNGRISDLRCAAAVVEGRKVSSGVRAWVVPGSVPIKRQAESEGLNEIFLSAGFEWREPGCSMCLAMNQDRLAPGERCASTSNRNFEGRQGRGGRTHLMSPQMAAAAAITGRLSDVRSLL